MTDDAIEVKKKPTVREQLEALALGLDAAEQSCDSSTQQLIAIEGRLSSKKPLEVTFRSLTAMCSALAFASGTAAGAAAFLRDLAKQMDERLPPDLESDTTVEQRSRWGTCPVCKAEHGEACLPIGPFLGVSPSGGPPQDGVHLARAKAAPMRYRLVKLH